MSVVFYRLHACYHGQGVGISSVEHWDDLKVKLNRTVGTDEQTTNFVMQDYLLITSILDLNFLYIFICTDTVVVLNYALFVYLCGF